VFGGMHYHKSLLFSVLLFVPAGCSKAWNQWNLSNRWNWLNLAKLKRKRENLRKITSLCESMYSSF